jgi:hypothetical protein
VPDAAYFRKQAVTCRKLARTILDQDAKTSLAAMAREYDGQAEKLEAEGKSELPDE